MPTATLERAGIVVGPIGIGATIVGAHRINSVVLTPDGTNAATATIAYTHPTLGPKKLVIRAPGAGPSAVFSTPIFVTGNITVTPAGTGAEVYLVVDEFQYVSGTAGSTNLICRITK